MKRKKNVRQRGGKTHGWGSMKKHRGAGNRGGRGNAGSGKRADQKKPMYWNAKKPQGQKYGKGYFGKNGFHSITGVEVNAINVQDMIKFIPTWVTEQKVLKSGDKYTVDLKALGYGKLLGTGKVTMKVKVIVAKASASAVEKISAAGGEVELLEAPAEVAAATE